MEKNMKVLMDTAGISSEDMARQVAEEMARLEALKQAVYQKEGQ